MTPRPDLYAEDHAAARVILVVARPVLSGNEIRVCEIAANPDRYYMNAADLDTFRSLKNQYAREIGQASKHQ